MDKIKEELKKIYPKITENELHQTKTALVELVATCLQIINKDNENNDTNIPENSSENIEK